MYSLTDKRTIDYLCRKYGFRLKKSLGQNFLNDDSVLFEIAEAAEIDGGGVIEIGPGIGVLTAVLAKRAEKVVAVELDKNLIPVLNETLAGFSNIEIVNNDILKIDINKMIEEKFKNMEVSVAANLPYYITTPIIMALIEKRLPVKNIVIMVQKEVAERIAAPPGGKDYGALTLTVNYYCEVSLVCNADKSMFTPPPKVDSTIIKLTVRKKPPVELISEKKFFALIKASFAQRRKTLFNCLKISGAFGSGDNIRKALSEAGIDPNVRGETLSMEEFARLSNFF